MQQVLVGVAYRWACLFSSCLLVRAGLLSGFGPLLFGVWPSARVSLMAAGKAIATYLEWFCALLGSSGNLGSRSGGS